MVNETKSEQSDKNAPIPIGKAIVVLLPLYVLIGGSGIWQIRRSCLLLRDECDFYGLLDWVLSDRYSLIGSVILLGVLLHITWHIVGLARAGKLGIEEDPPEPKFNVSGVMVALVVFLLYLGGSLAILMSAANDLGSLRPDNTVVFMWKILGPIYGSTFVWMTLWHINDYFVRPVSNIVLLLLFSATAGSIYLFAKLMIGNW